MISRSRGDSEPDLDRERSALELLQEALEQPAADQRGFVERRCAKNPALREEVLSLLSASAAAGDFLADSPGTGFTTWLAEQGAETELEDTAHAPLPEHIGNYVVLEKIAEGAMGIVYLAQQQQPISRQVAVKVTKQGIYGEETLRRFDAEIRTLARLEHPGIARIYDAGTHGDNVPYFVMEHVAGLPLMDFCDSQRTSLVDRIELFLRICDAVHYAHTKGVIHRDLKPNNILVMRSEEKAHPKVIDFGVAKLVEAGLVPDTQQTLQGLVVGTPQYMSPEQALPRGRVVDARADVYSLGVVLYELLSGVLPHGSESESVLEFFQRIGTTHAPRPSTRYSRLTPEVAATIAEHRETSVAKLRNTLSSDLDWIILMAIDPERDRRYRSVAAFADDIRRSRRCLPVAARPPSIVYRLRKLIVRNRALMTSACLLVITFTLCLIAILSGWQPASSRPAENYRAELRSAATSLARFDMPEVKRRLEATRPKPGKADHRDWEWHYLSGVLHSELATFDRSIGNALDQLAGDRDHLFWCSTNTHTATSQVSAWHTVDGEVTTYPLPWASIHRFALQPGGRRAAALVNEGDSFDLVAWDIPSLSLTFRKSLGAARGEAHGGVVFQPDGERLALLEGSSRVLILDGETGEELYRHDEAEAIHSLDYGPKGRLLLGTRQGVAECSDGSSESGTAYIGLLKPVVDATFSPDGEHVVAAMAGGILVLCKRSTGDVVRSVREHVQGITRVAFSPDGQCVASGGENGTVRVWDIFTGEILGTYAGHATPVTALRFDSSGRQLASADRAGVVKIWDVTAAPHHTLIEESRFAVEDLVLLESGPLALRWEGAVEQWKPSTGLLQSEELIPFAFPAELPNRLLTRVAALSLDGTRVACVNANDPTHRTVDIWSRTATGLSHIATLPTPDDTVCAIALSQSGQWAATMNYDVEDDRSIVRAWRTDDASLVREYDVAGCAYALSLSPDARWLVGTGSGVAPFLLDIRDGSLARKVPIDPEQYCSVVFDPTGSRLGFTFGSRAYIFAIESGQIVELRNPGHDLFALAFHPDGSRVAGVNREKVLLWDTHSGEPAFAFALPNLEPGDWNFVARIGFDPRGQRLAATNWRGDITIWDTVVPANQPLRERLVLAQDRAFLWHAMRVYRQCHDFAFEFHRRALAALEDGLTHFPGARAENYERASLWREAKWTRVDDAFLCKRQTEERIDAYCQARAAQRLDQHSFAADILRSLLAEEWDSSVTARLIRSLEAMGDEEQVAAFLFDALRRADGDVDVLWDQWFMHSLIRQRQSAETAIATLDKESVTTRSHAGALWALIELERNRAIRINCGGSSFVDDLGRTWAADRFFSWSRTLYQPMDISNTGNDELYHRRRLFIDPGRYRVPVPPGRYRVILYFAQTNHHARAAAGFDVYCEGDLVLRRYAPSASGFATATEKEFEVVVEDGFMEIKFRRWLSPAFVSAIEIIPAD